MNAQIEEEIRTYILENILFIKGKYPYADSTSLLGEGIIDSMNVLELVTFTENQYGIEVEDADITPDHFDSVEKLAQYIRQSLSQAKSSPKKNDGKQGFSPALGEIRP